jgi:hypothetical protein
VVVAQNRSLWIFSPRVIAPLLTEGWTWNKSVSVCVCVVNNDDESDDDDGERRSRYLFKNQQVPWGGKNLIRNQLFRVLFCGGGGGGV